MKRKMLARNRLVRIETLCGCRSTLELSIGPFSLRVDPGVLRSLSSVIDDALRALDDEREDHRLLLDVATPPRGQA